MAPLAKRRARKTIELSTGEMPQRIARQRVRRQQDDVDEQHERADAHPKFSVPPERVVRVFPQKCEKNDREIERVAMQILQNERKLCFTAVRAFRLTNGTRRRIGEKRAIVRF